MISTCPRCGAPTDGSWSEGGAKWALCPECLAAPAHPAARERDEQAAELARLRVENERLREALAGLVRQDEWMINIGGTEGPLPQLIIDEAARRRITLIDAARAALAQEPPA